MTQKIPRRESGTIKKLAQALGYSTRHTSKLLRDGMSPDPTAARAWLASRTENDGAAELRRRRIAVLIQQERRLKDENDREQNLVVSRAECKAEWTRIGSAISAMLTAAESEIPRIISGLPLAQALPKAKEKMREIREKFANEESEFWQARSESTPTQPIQ